MQTIDQAFNELEHQTKLKKANQLHQHNMGTDIQYAINHSGVNKALDICLDKINQYQPLTRYQLLINQTIQQQREADAKSIN